MKNLKLYLMVIGLLNICASLAQITHNYQMEKWYLNSKEFDMTSTIPILTNYLPSGNSGGPYNGIYDQYGDVIFYISGTNLYDKHGNIKSNFNINPYILTAGAGNNPSHEYPIVPFLDNSKCGGPQRYYVFYSFTYFNFGYYWCDGSTVLHAKIVTVDNGVVTVTDLNDPNNHHVALASTKGVASYGAGFAVSKVKNGTRFLYFAAINGIQKLTISPPTSPSDYGISPPIPTYTSPYYAYHTSPFELELSMDGTKLAWAVNGMYDPIELSRYGMIGLDAQGNWDQTVHFFYITPNQSNLDNTDYVRGVEFNDNGSLLYVTTGGTTAGHGVYAFDPSNNTKTYIPGTQNFGNSQIERASNGFLYVSDGTQISGISQANNSFPNGTASVLNGALTPYVGNYLPDQIDGEYYDDNLPIKFDVIISPHSQLGGYTGTATWTPQNNPINISGGPIKIDDVLTFVGGADIILEGMTFEFGINASLNITGGAKVTLKNTVLKGANCYNKMWNGIVVQDGGKLITTVSNGILVDRLVSSSYTNFITDAYTAITVNGTTSEFDIERVLFDGNENHITLNNVSKVNSTTNKIYECRFINTIPLNDQTYHGSINPNGLKYGKSNIMVLYSSDVSIKQNYFNSGLTGVNAYYSGVDIYNNIFQNMNDLHLDMNTAIIGNHSYVNAHDNIFNNVYRGYLINNNSTNASLFHETFNGVTSNAIEITDNNSCFIDIRNNNIYNFIKNGILLYKNYGIGTSITVYHNDIKNNNFQSYSTGICINEDTKLAPDKKSFKALTVNENTINNIAFGINLNGINAYRESTFPVVAIVNVYLYLTTSSWIESGCIYNNTINYHAILSDVIDPITLTKKDNYNSGIGADHCFGLKIFENTITSDLNTSWRNMGISISTTQNTLVRGNHVIAGRGISAKYDCMNNDYLCNVFNYNVNGLSLGDHTMRDLNSIGNNVHGWNNISSRDNTFLNTIKANGSDIELYLSWGTLNKPITKHELEANIKANKWLFKNTAKLIYYPDPNGSDYYNKPSLPVYNHFGYVKAGTAPDICSDEPLPYDPNHNPITFEEYSIPNDSFASDTLFYWQWEYGYEAQIKHQGQIRNTFISNLIDLEQFIADSQYTEANQLISSMTPTNNYEQNYLIILQIVINSRIDGRRLYTENEISILSSIASQNIRQAGPSVYNVRAILWCEVGLHFQEIENDRPQSIGAQIIFDPCYKELPSDISIQLVDENNTIYNDIPVIINNDGRFYITSDYVSNLNQTHSYKFTLNYENTNPGLLTLDQLFNTATNNYYLCNMGKKAFDKKQLAATTENLSKSSIQTVHIYPNPANDQINIDLISGNNYNIEIYNIVGKKIYFNNISESIIINSYNFENGVYVIRVIDSNGVQIKSERICVIK